MADRLQPQGLPGRCRLNGSKSRLEAEYAPRQLCQPPTRQPAKRELRERLVILRHVIKNALIPVVTLVGLQVPIIVGGSVIMEQMFAIPGLGWRWPWWCTA
ncbi:MAG: ABC transporter permease subunit [Anaerolineaceae bacterium]|nr:ABC transporter permease subunit [Anaerolineaceae bacterium]